ADWLSLGRLHGPGQRLGTGATAPSLSDVTCPPQRSATCLGQPSLCSASISRLSRSNPPACFARFLIASTRATGSWAGTRFASSGRETATACGGRFFLSLLLML